MLLRTASFALLLAVTAATGLSAQSESGSAAIAGVVHDAQAMSCPA